VTPDDIEWAFIREFSIGGNQIGKTATKSERRERVRQAIFVNDRINERFMGGDMTYADAFRMAYGERIDRRAATRALPDDDSDEPSTTEADDA
jgi:hypothetical protein